MSKKRTIAKRELEAVEEDTNIDNLSNQGDSFRKLIEECEKLGAAGLPDHPADYAWLGGAKNGKRRLTDKEVEDFQRSDLGEFTALEQILLRIIDKHPNLKIPRADTLKDKSVRQHRLEQAMKYLTGKLPSTGIKESDEANLEEIARKYHSAALELKNDHDFINLLIVSVIKPSKYSDDLLPEKADNIARRTREAFYKEFQRLMFKVTEGESTDQINRASTIKRLGDELLDLVGTSRPGPVEY